MNFLDDAVQEGSETLILVLRKQGLPSDTAYEIGADSLFTFTINDNDSPPAPGLQTRKIAQIIGAATGNQADSVGKSFRIFGTVYGINQRLTAGTGGFQMFIRDETGGIGLFKNAPVSGITILNEGDSLRVMGKVECFRGLSQIVPDSMVLIASGRPLKAPDLVTAIGEQQEANLIKMENLQVNPSSWTSGAGVGGFTARAFNGTDSVSIRIDNDCALFNQPVPSGTFTITGMVGQFIPGNPAPVAPFPASGYQIIPRKIADLTITTRLNPSCHCADSWLLAPNPGSDFVQITGNPASPEILRVFDITGRPVMETGITSGFVRLNVASLPEGIYLFRFVNSGRLVRWVKEPAK